MIKAASLFTGIGAPEYATREMPYEWLWGAEIDKNSNTIMRHNFPAHINLGDVNEKDFIERTRECGRPEIIVFGSPCQSFSVAGARGGLADPRGNLTLRALSIIDELQPKWFLWENVPGVLSNGFDTIINKISKCGYNGAWRVFDAQFFGVPQRRRRLFFLGHRGAGRKAAEILFNVRCPRRDSEARREEGQDSTRVIYEYHGQDSRVKETKNITPTLTRKMGTGGGNVPIIYERSQNQVIREVEKVGALLTQGKTDKGGAAMIYECHGQNETLRWLTPDEGESCQGFPKGWTDCVSQSARYRVVGDSMAVPVIEWILSRLEQHHAKKKI